MKHFHWYFYVGLGLFQSLPCRYLQRTLLFLCPMQLHGFEDNCFHWTQISFLSLRIRPSISWVGLGHNYTESSSSHQCVRILSCLNCTERVNDLLLAAADMCIPTFIVKKKTNPPWITKEVLNKIKKKKRLWRKLKAHPSEVLSRKFKELRRSVKQLVGSLSIRDI